MGRRLELHKKLVEVLGGSSSVYFQPPATVRMSYPAIVYELDNISFNHADNVKYKKAKRYQVTIIDRNPDSPYPDKLEELEYSSFSSHSVVNNLHHFVYSIYY